ncbi:sodium pump decarboxylases, gamma subunit [Alkalithermobacter thermoalcaliphilus JW-YL-7 = DSM 7308]|uniref:Sodium pump decarboxylase, gamma subunit n=1 Tax=Alkalithermobacter thermoalcaliphilus JW-YL-7 = DSM 7308 TaxID=1121328 RepID=A0A150FMN9_CLOPD|nr:sodium pump decarboxylase, gamma subunit [[Clostridium] paradoxum JW-YL-7 = DSM 7308]SHL31151.1 sodium pump decarboxylases, gamma subunit [[Clostridium] paradoxum JW-YL-7 = DSM 7308]
MDLSILIDKMSTDISSLTAVERLVGGLTATFLAMVIVFVVLILIMFCVSLMNRVLIERQKSKQEVESVSLKEEVYEEEDTNEEELIAVITSAIAASLNTSTSNIVVRNIIRTNSIDPAWSKAGRVEQMKKIY